MSKMKDLWYKLQKSKEEQDFNLYLFEQQNKLDKNSVAKVHNPSSNKPKGDKNA